MRKALALEPGNAEVLLRAGWVAAELGQWDRAQSLLDKSIERDPLLVLGHEYRAYLLMGLIRFDEAEAGYRKVQELSPGRTSDAVIGTALLQQGKPQEALREVEKEIDEGWRLFGLALVHHALGNRQKSTAALEALTNAHGEIMPVRVAEVHAWRGEDQLAFDWLDRAFEIGDSYIFDIKLNSYFQRLHGDPRYKAFLKKMKLPE